jgi:hypothetical protein
MEHADILFDKSGIVFTTNLHVTQTLVINSILSLLI